MSHLEGAVLKVLRSLRPGEILTYGEVAELAGYPGRARAVGRIMADTEEPIPWWRVVGAGGRIRSPASEEQRRLLIAEGHRVVGERVLPR